MANVYIRVPYYVASYFRTKTFGASLAPNEAIVIEETNTLWPYFIAGLGRVVSHQPSRHFSFCQKEWQRMLSGRSLAPGAGDKVLIPRREDELTLNDHEVEMLTGLKAPRNEDKGMYLCFALPREIFREGRYVKVDAWWHLTNAGVLAFRKQLINEFWRALFTYMDRRHDACAKDKRPFIVIDCLDSFMERHDIRCSSDYHERECLKRGMNRKRHEFKYSKEDYIEHGI